MLSGVSAVWSELIPSLPRISWEMANLEKLIKFMFSLCFKFEHEFNFKQEEKRNFIYDLTLKLELN